MKSVTRKRWTDDEKDWLRLCYPSMHTAKVAAVIGRPVSQCYQQAAKLGLSKTPEYLASDEACRLSASRRTAAMNATQFKKGQMSGAAQRNYVPVGSLRVCADGYLERKVTDDHPAPARRWIAVHRLVWEANHGPIPRGSIVVFRPGMKTVIEAEVTMDRLECITRAENARRNHPRSKSPELARLVQLKGAITRQVNRITREAQEQHHE